MTVKERAAVTHREAHGRLILLAIGVSDYSGSDFASLPTCVSDALEIRQVLLDVHQLNADPDRLQILTSKTKAVPSKGEIIKAIRTVVAEALSTDRLMIYYSGHGHRFPDEDTFYLVPQDAYEISQDALLDFAKVKALAQSAVAKQKIIIVDACMSGPKLDAAKAMAAKYSRKFLAEYMAKTKGLAVLSSSADNEKSFARSPDTALSLFTYYLARALRGAPEALDAEHMLTVNSAYEYVSCEVQRRAKSYQATQTPGFDVTANGAMILGDFSGSIIAPDQLDLTGYPITTLAFRDWSSLEVRDVLTKIRRTTYYSQDYLERKVNDNLDDFLRESFGRKAANLREQMGWTDVTVEGATISFPGGDYCAEYVADNERRGRLNIRAEFGEDWFERPQEMSAALAALGMHPTEVEFSLKKHIAPRSLIPGLQARSWRITSELDHEIKASRESYRVNVLPDKIIFDGFTASELLSRSRPEALEAANVLALLLGRG